MAGLVPAIHVFLALPEAKTWMPGTRPGMTTSPKEPYFIGSFFSQAPGSGTFAASRRMKARLSHSSLLVALLMS